MTSPAAARTFLFVPGDRPERFDKAVAAGPDLVILDLEDAVRAEHKEQARDHAAAWLRAGGRACVRVNAAGTRWHDADLTALQSIPSLAGVVLPMADSAAVAARVHSRVRSPLVAIIETAAGVLQAAQIAAADGVVRLAFGALDLIAELGTDDAGTLARVRTQLVLASRAAGLNGPVDSVTAEIADAEAAAADAHAARAVGMAGKLCIHPGQVSGVAAAFAPDHAELDWAERVLAAGRSGGVAVVDGQMIDEPVLLRARTILARSEQ